jgi:glycosyltransferase involved in cell wall biosynthesis
MHLLMLCAAPPLPAHGGGALRTIGILRGLHAHGYTIDLLTFSDTPTESVHPELRTLCQRVLVFPTPVRSRANRLLRLATTPQPDIAFRFRDSAYAQQLAQLLHENRYDLVHFAGIEAAIYLPDVQRAAPELPTVYDAFNAEYVLQQQIARVERDTPGRVPAALYSSIQAHRLARYERALCRAASAVIAVSDEDADALRPFRADGDITVVPNGIEVARYQTHGARLDLGQHVLAFTGKMDYRPNVDAMLWFADAILPLLGSVQPKPHLYIIGQQPHGSLGRLREHSCITLTGWVESVQPYLQACAVYIAPLRMGSGTRLKLLEAMAAGCAILATPTAAAGLQRDAHNSMVLAETAERFAAALIALLADDEQRARLGQAARRAVQAHYDWSVLLPRLIEVHTRLAKRATTHG